jgi:hypothetical protein
VGEIMKKSTIEYSCKIRITSSFEETPSADHIDRLRVLLVNRLVGALEPESSGWRMEEVKATKLLETIEKVTEL